MVSSPHLLSESSWERLKQPEPTREPSTTTTICSSFSSYLSHPFLTIFRSSNNKISSIDDEPLTDTTDTKQQQQQQQQRSEWRIMTGESSSSSSHGFVQISQGYQPHDFWQDHDTTFTDSDCSPIMPVNEYGLFQGEIVKKALSTRWKLTWRRSALLIGDAIVVVFLNYYVLHNKYDWIGWVLGFIVGFVLWHKISTGIYKELDEWMNHFVSSKEQNMKDLYGIEIGFRPNNAGSYWRSCWSDSSCIWLHRRRHRCASCTSNAQGGGYQQEHPPNDNDLVLAASTVVAAPPSYNNTLDLIQQQQEGRGYYTPIFMHWYAPGDVTIQDPWVCHEDDQPRRVGYYDEQTWKLIQDIHFAHLCNPVLVKPLRFLFQQHVVWIVLFYWFAAIMEHELIAVVVICILSGCMFWLNSWIETKYEQIASIVTAELQKNGGPLLQEYELQYRSDTLPSRLPASCCRYELVKKNEPSVAGGLEL